MQFFKTPNLAYMKIRRQAMLASLALIVIGLASMVVHKGFNTSIDFEGGTLVEIQTGTPVPLGTIRDIVAKAGFANSEVNTFGGPTEILIKVRRVGEAAEAAEKIKNALQAGAGTTSVEIRRMETVGPKIGSELKTSAFWAVMYSLAGLIVYITWRFQFKFAIAAIIALLHDVLIVLGFFSITNREISLTIIAAVLTLLGYSINDKIVVFDRIRENMRMRKRDHFDQIVNVSINEVLSRTLITGVATILVLLSLAVFAGETIRDFSLAMLIGIIFGTYSSIFIAAAVAVEWQTIQTARAKAKSR
ncbi:MAG: protein translocase subunit SecF [Chitinivibrionia bacterium]|nr:protein translocase subunit SecF [Chitinivibrionia bacterium]